MSEVISIGRLFLDTCGVCFIMLTAYVVWDGIKVRKYIETCKEAQRKDDLK